MPLSTDLTDALIPEDGSRISNGGPAQGRQAITEIVEPFAGRLLDPASGSGAMSKSRELGTGDNYLVNLSDVLFMTANRSNVVARLMDLKKVSNDEIF